MFAWSKGYPSIAFNCGLRPSRTHIHIHWMPVPMPGSQPELAAVNHWARVRGERRGGNGCWLEITFPVAAAVWSIESDSIVWTVDCQQMSISSRFELQAEQRQGLTAQVRRPTWQRRKERKKSGSKGNFIICTTTHSRHTQEILSYRYRHKGSRGRKLANFGKIWDLHN